jgi:hypothetical protein
MFDSQASGEKFIPKDILPLAKQSKSEELVYRMSDIYRVDHIPDLA